MTSKTRTCHPAAIALLAILIASPASLASQAVPASAGAPTMLEHGFRQNSAVLLPTSRASLDRIAHAIRAAPGATWEIAGYTSSAGTASRNLQVSRQRAEAVKAYLVSRGVPASSLTAVGYGAQHPAASNRTAAGRRKNMRVEIRRLPPSVRQATGAPAAVAPAGVPVAPGVAVAPASAAAVHTNIVRQDSTVAPTPARPVAEAPKVATPAKPRPAAGLSPSGASAAPAPAAAASAAPPGARDRGGFGFGLGYASYNTSYWFYGGGNSRWQAWSQAQASGFYEGRAPLKIGAWRTRYRVEARVGTGGADNNVGSGYVGNGTSLTNGSLTGGLAATLRLPLSAGTGTGPIPYVGLGVDFSVLWGFGDNSGSIYGKGWNERVLTVPLVVGVNLRTAHLTISPEIRYGFLGSSSSNLYLSGAGYAMQNRTPTMKGIFVSISWR